MSPEQREHLIETVRQMTRRPPRAEDEAEPSELTGSVEPEGSRHEGLQRTIDLGLWRKVDLVLGHSKLICRF
jgi:hypothetical protein